jgi:hypothetical protein
MNPSVLLYATNLYVPGDDKTLPTRSNFIWSSTGNDGLPGVLHFHAADPGHTNYVVGVYAASASMFTIVAQFNHDFVVSAARVVSCCVVCRVVLCRVSCRVVACRVVSCRVVSCRVVSCRVVSCRVVSCRVVSCRLVSSRVVSCRLVSSRL